MRKFLLWMLKFYISSSDMLWHIGHMHICGREKEKQRQRQKQREETMQVGIILIM